MKATNTRNWPEYNDRLRKRGSLVLWLEESALQGWYAEPEEDRKPGRPRTYSQECVRVLLQLKHFYGLGYRQNEGFAASLVQLLGMELQVPSYSQQSRRARTLDTELESITPLRQRCSHEPLYVVVDSTGLKIYGEGEWKVRCHGRSKKRTWRKLHLSVDTTTGEILSAVFTGNEVSDGEVLDDLLEGIDEPIAQLSGDGGYDQIKCYDALVQRSEEQQHPLTVTIPPRKTAKILRHGNSSDPPHPRDENLRTIRKRGRRAWKRDSGYHQRSKAETAVYRFKRTFGERLSSRTPEAQAVETLLKCSMLNRLLFAEDFGPDPPS